MFFYLIMKSVHEYILTLKEIVNRLTHNTSRETNTSLVFPNTEDKQI